MKIALIMLAAGNSRRFGSNKLLYEIDGKPMYRHILEKLMIVAEQLEETECIEKVECGEHLEKQNEEGYKPSTKIVTILTRTERRLQVGKELVNTYMYLIWKAN